MKLPKWRSWFNRVRGGVFEHPMPEPQTPEPAKVEKGIVTFDLTKAQFDAEAEDVRRFRTYITGIACPICGQAKMELVAYEKGTEGWEAGISCTSCFVKGVFNDGGFRVVKPVEIRVRE